jgi:replicative DNA helicase
MTSRLDFEIAILGACMLEQDAFPRVMDVLTPQNFTKEVNGIDHQKIFSIMLLLYPTQPINIKTVAIKLPGYGYIVSNYANHVSSAACIKHDAFILLEFCFRENFIQTLQKINTNTLMVKAAINDLIGQASDGDIFDLIENASAYLFHIGASTEGQIIRELEKKVGARIRKIKEAAKIETLFSNLQNLVQIADSQNKMAMEKLVELTKQILVKGSLEKNQLRKLLEI